MGKVRRLRQKYHTSVAKEKKERTTESPGPTVPLLVPKLQESSNTTSASGNMFSGLQISFGEARRSCSDSKMDTSDTMSVVSTGTQSRMATKKDKRKQRHEEVMQKLNFIQSSEKAEKDKKKREKTVIVGDMHPMLDALPSLHQLINKEKNKQQQYVRNKGTPKQKEAAKQFLDGVDFFVKVHKDPIFKNDPFGSMSQAIANRLIADNDTDGSVAQDLEKKTTAKRKKTGKRSLSSASK